MTRAIQLLTLSLVAGLAAGTAGGEHQRTLEARGTGHGDGQRHRREQHVGGRALSHRHSAHAAYTGDEESTAVSADRGDMAEVPRFQSIDAVSAAAYEELAKKLSTPIQEPPRAILQSAPGKPPVIIFSDTCLVEDGKADGNAPSCKAASTITTDQLRKALAARANGARGAFLCEYRSANKYVHCVLQPDHTSVRDEYASLSAAVSEAAGLRGIKALPTAGWRLLNGSKVNETIAYYSKGHRARARAYGLATEEQLAEKKGPCRLAVDGSGRTVIPTLQYGGEDGSSMTVYTSCPRSEPGAGGSDGKQGTVFGGGALISDADFDMLRGAAAKVMDKYKKASCHCQVTLKTPKEAAAASASTSGSAAGSHSLLSTRAETREEKEGPVTEITIAKTGGGGSTAAGASGTTSADGKQPAAAKVPVLHCKCARLKDGPGSDAVTDPLAALKARIALTRRELFGEWKRLHASEANVSHALSIAERDLRVLRSHNLAGTVVGGGLRGVGSASVLVDDSAVGAAQGFEPLAALSDDMEATALGGAHARFALASPPAPTPAAGAAGGGSIWADASAPAEEAGPDAKFAASDRFYTRLARAAIRHLSPVHTAAAAGEVAGLKALLQRYIDLTQQINSILPPSEGGAGNREGLKAAPLPAVVLEHARDLSREHARVRRDISLAAARVDATPNTDPEVVAEALKAAAAAGGTAGPAGALQRLLPSLTTASSGAVKAAAAAPISLSLPAKRQQLQAATSEAGSATSPAMIAALATTKAAQEMTVKAMRDRALSVMFLQGPRAGVCALWPRCTSLLGGTSLQTWLVKRVHADTDSLAVPTEDQCADGGVSSAPASNSSSSAFGGGAGAGAGSSELSLALLGTSKGVHPQLKGSDGEAAAIASRGQSDTLKARLKEAAHPVDYKGVVQTLALRRWCDSGDQHKLVRDVVVMLHHLVAGLKKPSPSPKAGASPSATATASPSPSSTPLVLTIRSLKEEQALYAAALVRTSGTRVRPEGDGLSPEWATLGASSAAAAASPTAAAQAAAGVAAAPGPAAPASSAVSGAMTGFGGGGAGAAAAAPPAAGASSGFSVQSADAAGAASASGGSVDAAAAGGSSVAAAAAAMAPRFSLETLAGFDDLDQAAQLPRGHHQAAAAHVLLQLGMEGLASALRSGDHVMHHDEHLATALLELLTTTTATTATGTASASSAGAGAAGLPPSPWEAYGSSDAMRAADAYLTNYPSFLRSSADLLPTAASDAATAQAGSGGAGTAAADPAAAAGLPGGGAGVSAAAMGPANGAASSGTTVSGNGMPAGVPAAAMAAKTNPEGALAAAPAAAGPANVGGASSAASVGLEVSFADMHRTVVTHPHAASLLLRLQGSVSCLCLFAGAPSRSIIAPLGSGVLSSSVMVPLPGEHAAAAPSASPLPAGAGQPAAGAAASGGASGGGTAQSREDELAAIGTAVSLPVRRDAIAAIRRDLSADVDVLRVKEAEQEALLRELTAFDLAGVAAAAAAARGGSAAAAAGPSDAGNSSDAFSTASNYFAHIAFDRVALPPASDTEVITFVNARIEEEKRLLEARRRLFDRRSQLTESAKGAAATAELRKLTAEEDQIGVEQRRLKELLAARVGSLKTALKAEAAALEKAEGELEDKIKGLEAARAAALKRLQERRDADAALLAELQKMLAQLRALAEESAGHGGEVVWVAGCQGGGGSTGAALAKRQAKALVLLGQAEEQLQPAAEDAVDANAAPAARAAAMGKLQSLQSAVDGAHAEFLAVSLQFEMATCSCIQRVTGANCTTGLSALSGASSSGAGSDGSPLSLVVGGNITAAVTSVAEGRARLKAARAALAGERRRWEEAVVRLARPKTCSQLQALSTSARSGVYTIFPPDEYQYAGVRVYCDMTTDGGGWTLVGVAPGGRLPGPLGVQGGAYDPLDRSHPGNVNALWVAQASAEAAISWTDAQTPAGAPAGGMGSYGSAVAFRIPDPSSASLALLPPPPAQACGSGNGDYAAVLTRCLKVEAEGAAGWMTTPGNGSQWPAAAAGAGSKGAAAVSGASAPTAAASPAAGASPAAARAASAVPPGAPAAAAAPAAAMPAAAAPSAGGVAAAVPAAAPAASAAAHPPGAQPVAAAAGSAQPAAAAAAPQGQGQAAAAATRTASTATGAAGSAATQQNQGMLQKQQRQQAQTRQQQQQRRQQPAQIARGQPQRRAQQARSSRRHGRHRRFQQVSEDLADASLLGDDASDAEREQEAAAALQQQELGEEEGEGAGAGSASRFAAVPDAAEASSPSTVGSSAASWAVEEDARSRMDGVDDASVAAAAAAALPLSLLELEADADLFADPAAGGSSAAIVVAADATTAGCAWPARMYTGTTSLGVCEGHAYGVVLHAEGKDKDRCDAQLPPASDAGAAGAKPKTLGVFVGTDDAPGCAGVAGPDGRSIVPAHMAVWVR